MRLANHESERSQGSGRAPGTYRRSARPRRGGAAAAELALVLPFLALMFAVALDYCRIFHVSQTVQNCAWVGAMYASGNASNPNAASSDDAARQAAVADAASLQPPLDPSKVTIAYQGGMAVVTIQYEFRAMTPLLGKGGTVTVTRTVKMTMAPTGP
jgi:Flp pilus assembly protein TadG